MSGSTFKAAAWTGDVNDFFPRSERGVVRLGVFSANVGVVTDAKVEVLGVPFGCLSGDLKGERNGLERVVDAASILRRLAAGVDIFSRLSEWKDAKAVTTSLMHKLIISFLGNVMLRAYIWT